MERGMRYGRRTVFDCDGTLRCGVGRRRERLDERHRQWERGQREEPGEPEWRDCGEFRSVVCGAGNQRLVDSYCGQRSAAFRNRSGGTRVVSAVGFDRLASGGNSLLFLENRKCEQCWPERSAGDSAERIVKRSFERREQRLRQQCRKWFKWFVER